MAAGGYKNLKPIKKGEVRNPTGKNGSDWVTEMRAYFGTEMVEDATQKGGGACNRLRIVFASVYRSAIKGDSTAQRLIVEQMCGKARESVDLTNGGSPFGAAQVVLYLPDDGSDDPEEGPEEGGGEAAPTSSSSADDPGA